jgi:hypothetical protein
MKEYARRGAQARVEELTQELAAIYRAFPELRRGGASALSAAMKREVSRRMKKYWADRRKANAK